MNRDAFSDWLGVEYNGQADSAFKATRTLADATSTEQDDLSGSNTFVEIDSRIHELQGTPLTESEPDLMPGEFGDRKTLSPRTIVTFTSLHITHSIQVRCLIFAFWAFRLNRLKRIPPAPPSTAPCAFYACAVYGRGGDKGESIGVVSALKEAIRLADAEGEFSTEEFRTNKGTYPPLEGGTPFRCWPLGNLLRGTRLIEDLQATNKLMTVDVEFVIM
ncbi:hypothetical protein BDN71DRAFT_1437145 [Pleurotus eryngii]|uniref:Uncharacterized protein n=1 Tax=Pleurotus eryngii TaxID=5323 RepID=A0A9P5ZI37_PLEER|nr:hypothetical protein BDN71DRAFT_1437145 [Pleurotus eryngii]